VSRLIVLMGMPGNLEPRTPLIEPDSAYKHVELDHRQRQKHLSHMYV
jgi:hypothetical protein